MKHKLLNIYIFSFFILTDFITFAQTPGDDGTGGGGGLEGEDPPPAPINEKLIWLVILGIIFAYYTLKKNRKEA